MAVRVRLGDRTVDVEATIGEDAVTLVVDAAVHGLPYRRLGDGRVLVDVGDRRVAAWTDGAWAIADGRARRVARLPPGTRDDDVAPTVTPPMPAVVSRVLVAVGAVVRKGDRVVLVSAMKTELALRAPRDGVVTEIRAEPGQAVRPGQILVEIG